MKREDVKIGMEVRCVGDPEKGTVIGLPDQYGVVEVRWTPNYTTRCELDELEAVDPIADQQKAIHLQFKIDEAKNAFEKAFAALAEVQNDNLLHYFEGDGLISTRELEKTIDENGWSSSSLWC